MSAKSLATTVATPSKCPGRCAPQRGPAVAPTRTRVSSPGGYIASAAGANTAEAPARSHFSASAASVRG